MASDTLFRKTHYRAIDALNLATAVESVLAEFLHAEAATLESTDPALGPFARTGTDAVLAGGKRLRPTFAYWGWRGVAGPDAAGRAGAARAGRAGAAARLRPGARRRDGRVRHPPRPAHRAPRARRRHSTQGLRGDPDRFGESAAILVGDLCLVWADQLMAARRVPAQTLLRGPRAGYDRMRVEAIAGQFLDVLGESAPELVGRAGAAHGPAQDRRATRSPGRCSSARRSAGRARPRPLGARVRPLRPGGRRGVPAPRRPARRLRRPGRHRQAGRRRPGTGKPTVLLHAGPALADAGPARRAGPTAGGPANGRCRTGCAELIAGDRRRRPRSSR